jgi:hypothetical protein
MCEVSAQNVETSPRKHAMKKCIFSASVYMEKFCNLIQIFNTYELTKWQTIVYKRKILSFMFW